MGDNPNRVDSEQGLPESYPKINISAKMFIDRMNNYCELQSALGNKTFDNEKVKVITFLNNVTDRPGNNLQLYTKRLKQQNRDVTYDELCVQFKKDNTNLAEQENLMTALTYELRPDTTIYKHEQAINDYVNKYNEKLNQLEEQYDEQRMKDAFMHMIHPALKSQLQALLVSQQKAPDRVTLFDLQQLAIANANSVQDKWLTLRNNIRDKQGVKRPYQQTRVNHMEQSNGNMNDYYNNNSNTNTSSINAVSSQPRNKMELVLQYCEAKNLCRWCKQVRHLAANERCYVTNKPNRIPEDELNAYAQSRGYQLNFRGRQK
jgi:hypothetical protein